MALSQTLGNASSWARFAMLFTTSMALTPSSSADSVDGRDFDCLLEPKTRVMVGATTQGIVHTVNVRRGERVEKGQVVATLDARLEQAELEHAKMRAQMTSDIGAREADLKFAEVSMQRLDDLHRQKMVPAQQRDEAIAAREVARMALAQARDTRKLYEHEYARAREVVEQHVIRSPLSGVVVDQVAYPGEFVYENPILIVAQIDPLKVEAILPARFFGGVSVGMPAALWPEIDAGGPLNVAISSVDQIIDSASGTFSVHLDVQNPDSAIPGGQRCRLAFGDVDAADLGDRFAAGR
ncbi:MAG: efflux RND transporter periplasmic adaptor subunit [Gammaproteobacteria bacterium]